MEIAITFVAAPGSEHLLADLGQRVKTAIGSNIHLHWLAEGEALDIILGECAEIKKLAAALVGSHPIDWCVQPMEKRRKRMLIADMDSTIIGQECLDEMADLKGIKTEIAALTERAMRGELDFEDALRERISLARGLDGRRLAARP